MSLSRTAARLLKGVLSRFGLVAMRRATADEILETHLWLADRLGEPAAKNTPKLVDAASPNAPSSTDPRLVDLRRRYAGHTAATHSVWTPEHLVAELTLERFREDNACVCQTRVNNRFIG